MGRWFESNSGSQVKKGSLRATLFLFHSAKAPQFVAEGRANTALLAILNEWISTHDYKIRVSNLMNGSGSADRMNASYFLNDNTTHDEGAADKLTGGLGRDWFLYNSDGDGRSSARSTSGHGRSRSRATV